jgi:hypothetical protein
MGSEPGLVAFGIGDGGGKRDAAEPGRELLQARHGEREEIAALAGREGVDFVDDDGAEVCEQKRAVFVAEEERQRFGGGQQHVRRLHALALLAVGRRVAGAGLDPDVEVHLGDRGEEIALDVDGEGFERRDVEGVERLDPPRFAGRGTSLRLVEGVCGQARSPLHRLRRSPSPSRGGC